MAVNIGILKSVLGIMKILTMIFALLAVCTIAYCAGPKYENDRFNFVVCFGLLALFWCLVTFLLYLFDVTSKFKPGTVTSLEIVGCVFLLLLSVQAFVYACQAAVNFASFASMLGTQTIDDDIKGKINSEDASSYRSLFGLPTVANVAGKAQEAKPIWIDTLTKASNLNAASAVFCVLAMITLVVTLIMAKREGGPVGAEAQGAYVN